MLRLLCVLLWWLPCALGAQGTLRIAVLHPLLGELAQGLGGEAVQVLPLYSGAGDLHEFAPGTAELAAAAQAPLLLACGKGVEPYLNDLRRSLPPSTAVVELGATLPDVCLPGTAVADPHWWNSPAQVRRAARVLLVELCRRCPEHRAAFTERFRALSAELDALHREAALRLAAIPPEQRVLVTGHAAFCHWCAEFGFTPVAVYGVAHESEGDAASLAALLAELRRAGARCLFTEAYEEDRGMVALAQQLGAGTQALIADGISPEHPGYADIFRRNVQAVCDGLADGKEGAQP
ncbi:MAG: metal ABC transporter substrate-binding protein [Akkermansia sp.]